MKRSIKRTTIELRILLTARENYILLTLKRKKILYS